MKTLLTILLTSFVLLLNAQSSGIKGHVYNDDLKEPIAAATVSIGGVGIITNFKGFFICDLMPGTYAVSFSCVGFDEQTFPIEVKSGAYEELNISLLPAYNLLEQTTITDSKIETKITDSPVSINIITPELIESQNITDISEMIDKTTGVQVVDGQVSIRGGSGWSYGAGSRVIVLIDGLPATQADAHRPNWADIPVEIIDQVEIIKGASSVLYGSSAVNGIINVRSKNATTKPETKFTLSYNHFMNVNPRISTSQWWGNDKGFSAPSEMNISGFHRQKRNKLEFVMHSFYSKFNDYYQLGISEGHMQDEKFRFGSNFKYKASDRITLKLGGLLVVNDNQSPLVWLGPNFFLTPIDPNIIEGTNVRFNIDPSIQLLDQTGNRHTFQSRFYYINNENSNAQSNQSFTSYGEYQFQRNFYKVGVTLTSGFYSSFTTSNAVLYGGEEITERNLAWYSQFEKDILNKCRFIAGLRVENYKQKSAQFVTEDHPLDFENDTQAIGRLGLTFDANETSIFRVSWGQGYRFPSIAERFIQTEAGGYLVASNPDLISEKGWSSEIGLKQGWAVSRIQGYIDIAGFWSRFDNMVEFIFEPDARGFRSENIGNTDIKGVEFNITGSSRIGNFPFTFMTGYTYTDPRYTNLDDNSILQNSLSTGENVLKYRSKHNFKADVEIGYKMVKLGTSISQLSHVINIDQNFNSIGMIGLFRESYNDGYLRLDARLSYQFESKKTPQSFRSKFSIVCRNLTNEIYAQRIGVLNAPRSISAQVQISF